MDGDLARFLRSRRESVAPADVGLPTGPRRRTPGLRRAELATVTGDNLSLSRDGDSIVVGDGAGGRARIVRADQLQSNGAVHSIDAVLMPTGQ